MKRILFLIALFAIIMVATVHTAETTKETSKDGVQEQKVLTKEEKAQKKAEEKAKKAEEKKLKQEQKLKQKEEELKKKEQEKLQKEEAKKQKAEQEKQKVEQEKQEKEAQQQAQLEAEARQTCTQGQFQGQDGTCVQCSENCENCSTPSLCNYCKPGFYRVVVDKKMNAYCSSQIPQGYLPNISKFSTLNPQVQIQKPTEYAVAVDGKKVITGSPQPLPFQIVDGVPTTNGQKVRLDVVPCKSQCKVCPEGFLRTNNTNECFTEQQCAFPYEILEQNGQKVCKENDPSVFRGQISVTQKQEEDSTVPSKKRLNLQAITNQKEEIGISYEWQVLDSQQADVTDAVLAQKFGKKVKGTFAQYEAGTLLTLKVTVKDTKIENAVQNVISQEYKLN